MIFLAKGPDKYGENGFSEPIAQVEQEILPADLYEMTAGRRLCLVLSKFLFPGVVHWSLWIRIY